MADTDAPMGRTGDVTVPAVVLGDAADCLQSTDYDLSQRLYELLGEED